MKLNFKFTNLLGTVYKQGNFVFTKDGGTLLSPVGNRITSFDLKYDKAHTLPFTSSYNICHIALSPTEPILLAVTKKGEGYLISTLTGVIIAKQKFNGFIKALSFSPDGRLFAIVKGNIIMVYFSPGSERQYNQFLLYRIFVGPTDSVKCIDWSSDSKVFVVGGEDLNTRIYAVDRMTNLVFYSVCGHSEALVGTFFAANCLDVYSVSQNGQVCVWECDTPLEDLIPWTPESAIQRKQVAESEKTEEYNVDLDADDDEEMTVDDLYVDDEDGDVSVAKAKKLRKRYNRIAASLAKNKNLINYRKAHRYSYCEMNSEKRITVLVTCVDFHKKTNLLASGLANGCFMLHMMPDFTPIHSLNVSDVAVTTIKINAPGNWLALGCSERGQMVVWEWESKTFIRKSESHHNQMNCATYSPDGSMLASGGTDSKIKLWRVGTGTCFVTFPEHQAAVSSLVFPQYKPQTLFSASLDGTVRAFDLHRYRNFRTLTTPRPSQFSALAVDCRGEMAAAGCLDSFEAHVWSVQTGQLLVTLAGHTGPISGISFSGAVSTGGGSGEQIATVSWDGTLRTWDFLESRDAKDNIQLLSDGLAVAYRPDGLQIAVALLNSSILFFDTKTASQEFSVEGHHHLGYTKTIADKVSCKKASEDKCFQTICYSPDGRHLLAAGNSNYVCLFSIADQILIKRFEVTCNLSLDGVVEMHNRRLMKNWTANSMSDRGQGPTRGKTIPLPGVREGDFSRRNFIPEVNVSCVNFSPTGQSFCVTSTEGLLIYSQQQGLILDPVGIDESVTPDATKAALTAGEHGQAIEMALKLKQTLLIQEVMEAIPVSQAEYIAHHLSPQTSMSLLHFLASQLEYTRHLEFYLVWVDAILFALAPILRRERNMDWRSALLHLERPLRKVKEKFNENCDWLANHSAYFATLVKLEKAKQDAPSESMIDIDIDSS